MSEHFSGIPVISRHITTRFIDNEAFIMNLENLKTYYLNETASRVWSLIDGAMTFDNIVDELIKYFEVSRDECISEVSQLMKSLSSEHLIEISKKLQRTAKSSKKKSEM